MSCAAAPGVTRTTCPYCGVGCGVEVSVAPDGRTSVRGDPDHPANRGRLCSKGAALAETLDPADRLLRPVVDGVERDWETALDRVAGAFRATIAAHGPDAVAFYVSGQLLTEDYYVVNKFVKGWLGTANVDTNSRLCMASSVAGHVRAFGSDTVPGGYDDLELADLVVLVGSNLAWCHPVLHQRLAAAKAARPDLRVVLVDPRRTATAELADLHLPVAPGGDTLLFVGLLAHLHAAGLTDGDWIAGHTSGFDACIEAARAPSVVDIARGTGLDRRTLLAFYTLFAERRRVVTVYSQGVNQSERGTDTVNAILNCHLATNRIGRAGCGPFSVTGQPNAMGGREVGGLANMLAAHLSLERAEHRELVQGFWGSPRIADRAGPKAVELFERVHDGRIKALWVMATNPAVSLPDADRVDEALARCPFVVVSDVTRDTDTLRHATVALPAAAWSEKDGTVTNSERRISRQRAFRAPPGDARPDWWAVAEVARRLGGGGAFDYPDASAIFREHAALSATANDEASATRRDFDIGACATLDRAGYDALEPFRWPWRAGEARAESRFFADGRFFTPDGRGRFVPIAVARPSDDRPVGARVRVGRPAATALAPTGSPAAGTLVLNTGRVRDQWHTMTRTGRVARLSAHLAEPFAELHPLDAAARGIGDADIVELSSPYGQVRVRALLSERQRPGSVFVPMHWSAVFAASARVDSVVAPRTDPVSGQPASKSTRVHVRRALMRSHGLALIADRVSSDADGGRTRREHATSGFPPAGAMLDDYWAIGRCEGGWRVEFADARPAHESAERWLGLLRRWGDASRRDDVAIGAPPALARTADATRGTTHAALFDGDRLLAAVHVGPGPVAVSRSFCAGLLTSSHATPAARQAALLGRPAGDVPEQGAIVCACLGVGARRILDLAASDAERRSVAAIGASLGAGTQCGSCRGEIAALLRTLPAASAPAEPAPVARDRSTHAEPGFVPTPEAAPAVVITQRRTRERV